MKKGFVALLLALAVIVLVSPGLIGKLAEESMDENLRWAATETPEVSITSQGYDRGGFSSEGQHRVEVHDGELADALLYLFGESKVADLPALIIDTKIDHGLVAAFVFPGGEDSACSLVDFVALGRHRAAFGL